MAKVRCSFPECKAAARPIVGDCSFCKGKFCSTHRLLEDHNCRNLEDVSFSLLLLPNAPESQWWLAGLEEVLSEDELANLLRATTQCKREAHEQNAMQLNRERTQVIKTA